MTRPASPEPPEEADVGAPPPVYPIMGATGMGIPDEALAAGETLEDELVSDEGDDRPVGPRRERGRLIP